ncbi:hypothetical protein CCAX7_55340 [Capsulimonas corticalis]|uniref:Uncharacterized protein n=1 Tax=Capsulimonas corticalis TaxID=2219043 RepID=A0A402D5J0_9BACT|nr:hypothetical protein [Capsulimonas corticalis]BDI33483.1 hypothetical protein CCAX7_55340 [Capsulimonas corticalis]
MIKFHGVIAAILTVSTLTLPCVHAAPATGHKKAAVKRRAMSLHRTLQTPILADKIALSPFTLLPTEKPGRTLPSAVQVSNDRSQ